KNRRAGSGLAPAVSPSAAATELKIKSASSIKRLAERTFSFKTGGNLNDIYGGFLENRMGKKRLRPCLSGSQPLPWPHQIPKHGNLQEQDLWHAAFSGRQDSDQRGGRKPLPPVSGLRPYLSPSQPQDRPDHRRGRLLFH